MNKYNNKYTIGGSIERFSKKRYKNERFNNIFFSFLGFKMGFEMCTEYADMIS